MHGLCLKSKVAVPSGAQCKVTFYPVIVYTANNKEKIQYFAQLIYKTLLLKSLYVYVLKKKQKKKNSLFTNHGFSFALPEQIVGDKLSMPQLVRNYLAVIPEEQLARTGMLDKLH